MEITKMKLKRRKKNYSLRLRLKMFVMMMLMILCDVDGMDVRVWKRVWDLRDLFSCD